MKGIRCLASLPMAPETISKLNDAGFRTIDDIKGLGPVALANGVCIIITVIKCWFQRVVSHDKRH